MSDVIEIETRVEASQQVVWRCLTQSDDIHQWWNDQISLDPKLGGRFNEPFKHTDGSAGLTTGMVVEFAEPDTLQLSIRDKGSPNATRVSVHLTSVGRRTDLVLTHVGWDMYPPGERDQLKSAYQEGWKTHIEKLKAHCEAEVKKG